jgi:hypothetical protein
MHAHMYARTKQVSLSLFSMYTVKSVLGPTQLPIQWVPADLTPGVKRPGREAHHSPPSSSEVKNA